jgi:hypothetical protein
MSYNSDILSGGEEIAEQIHLLLATTGRRVLGMYGVYVRCWFLLLTVG